MIPNLEHLFLFFIFYMNEVTPGALELQQPTLRSFTSIDSVSVRTLCSPESGFKTEPKNDSAVVNERHTQFITRIVAAALLLLCNNLCVCIFTVLVKLFYGEV